ncbi:PLP-dependent aminotransferase family protein [Aquibium sp. LZ166]|uniref:PLP-dependent aminotransferase family protein n=1 Tax=Aquibium pacificus TaxID=3153579 RepID=A0ABV3SE12_9HYPH
MTNWMPKLTEGAGPLYLRLAGQIESDIASGALPVGAKLPPQRNLAYDIGVTIGTVGRAYALVREKGLVSGEVGRGTFVLGSESAAAPDPHPAPDFFGGTRAFVSPPGQLRLDTTAAPDVGQTAAIEALTSRIAREQSRQSLDYVRTAAPSWLEAGRAWLAADDWRPQADDIVPALGAHAAILSVIAAVTAPGDRIVFEQLTYSSVARSAALIGRRPVAVDMDGEGMCPEDFEHLCAQQHPKMAFLMPDMQNPTLGVLSEARRRQIVEIARRYNVWLIEDAVYGSLIADRAIPLAALAPERTFHVGGLSKSVAAGIRAGWVACPPYYAARVQTAYRMLTGGKPFLLAELAARLVLSGEADAIRARVRREIADREAMARELLAGLDFVSGSQAPFLWMKLPEPWLSGIFRNAAASEGVLIDEEDEFKPSRTDKIFHRIRIAFSGPPVRDDVRLGLGTVRRLLEGGAAGHDNFG